MEQSGVVIVLVDSGKRAREAGCCYGAVGFCSTQSFCTSCNLVDGGGGFLFISLSIFLNLRNQSMFPVRD